MQAQWFSITNRQQPTGGEARWEVEELLQELADAELEKQVMVTAGVAAMENNEDTLKHAHTHTHTHTGGPTGTSSPGAVCSASFPLNEERERTNREDLSVSLENIF